MKQYQILLGFKKLRRALGIRTLPNLATRRKADETENGAPNVASMATATVADADRQGRLAVANNLGTVDRTNRYAKRRCSISERDACRIAIALFDTNIWVGALNGIQEMGSEMTSHPGSRG